VADEPSAPPPSRPSPTEEAAQPASTTTATPRSEGTKRPVVDVARRERRRGWLLAVAIYLMCTVSYAILAGDRLANHTMNDHFAVQAEAWHEGRWYLTEEDIVGRQRRGELDMYNDWAVVRHVDPATHKVEVRYFNSFPVFPAVLMYPFVAAAGSALMFRDALFVVTLAGIGPALLFLALERLRRDGRNPRTMTTNALLAGAFAFGTVYFYTAIQGSVWFAAHVVGVALTCGYILASVSSARLLWCIVAGVLVGCDFHTRTPTLLGVALFAYESARASLRAPVREAGSFAERMGDAWAKLDLRQLAVRWGFFAVPILVAIWLTFRINQARFGNPWEFGHTLLNVVWMERVKRWGLFSYHYLSRNMTCAFTLLPILNPEQHPPNVARVQFSANGLALWVTTPFYLWLLWPRVKNALHGALWLTVIPIALLDLSYQNSGWMQFGYRFSNDFAPYLFVLLAIGGRPFGRFFRLAAAFSVAINYFGAISFQRKGFDRYYFIQTYTVPTVDGTQSLQSSTYPPD
jgi:hypothetical protein